MTAQIYNVDSNGFTAEEMAQMQHQLDGLTPEQRATSHHFRPAVMPTARSEVIMRNGAIVEQTVTDKSRPNTAHVNQPTPGKINIAGMVTDVSAAKAAGILPPRWQEGDPLPFDAPAGAPEGAKAGAPDSNKTSDSDSASDEGEGSDSHGAHLAKVAGEVLHGVQQVHGAQATERLLSAVADSGDPDSILDQLPHGVTEAHVQQVMAGYVAQTNSQLATVGASVPMLEDLLSDDDLRAARAAAIANNKEAVQDLGRKAVNALAQLPQTDPEGLKEMIDGMTPEDRKCLRYDRNSREWRVTLPNMPEMSYGAAVRLGYVKV